MTQSKIRPLTRDEVTFELSVEEYEQPVNFQSGDLDYKKLDDKLEEHVRARLSEGDIWAWAHVKLIARWGSFAASASVGGCSYQDEEDFIKCGEAVVLETEALHRLNDIIESIYNTLNARAI